MAHTPVLLQEVLEYLNVQKGEKYIDCTLGDGGHTLEILRRGGKVLGIDVDAASLEAARGKIADLGLSAGFVGVQGNFANIDKLATSEGFACANGIVYDLGFSSRQLEEGGLGLSFHSDEVLDMRMDKSLAVQAADLVNALSKSELEKLFSQYGQERYAKRFANAIVTARNLKKIRTTKDLVNIIVAEAPPGYEKGRIHPATRVFLALRVAVNDELENLSKSLPQAAALLCSPVIGEPGQFLPGGRMLVISFNSLEDRLVKEFSRSARLKEVVAGVVTPGDAELATNVRSRSAKLRVYEKNTQIT
ncbi:MAG: Ribosomal RNA small subunit methyltransferase H [candidate division WWE3 bacterium GW2011_GWA1_46_21]|uniref:Ribosomal RNA small subunit methyltransferase H n=3 Tax=Katanobacteria TaxID=422282 RepID=A0A0G1PBL7_UNCKA|nr:MAG: Ribosomal RNA small subunit methyltransferase H [candidate division WWE3 bacterium GW2011_GWA1_46_21]KKU48391.1 MAG: Ribosomal RNA small subunit methyltransferase H [candidate division WWE3 bacterium GW2011_GWA2_46_9]KKU50934.1 MAG: Ribosomal RNA small subunit methyltransferase H [candidate division WWE3 bacterium GW2011_GWC1_47_10]